MKKLFEFEIGQIWKYVGEDRKYEESRRSGEDDPDTYVIITEISDDPNSPEPLCFQLISSGVGANDLTYPIGTIRKAFVRIC